jgi:uncharacterized protein (TIGR03083 family)
METIPIPTLHLFQKLDKKLIDLLQSLSPDDWDRPTLAKLWTVKDIATHLLDGNIRFISILRDGYFGDKPGQINSYQDLVNYLNQLNADWVKATKRLSPKLLTDLLESTGKEYYNEISKLDPFKPALFSVAWAGEEESMNWFHIAREFTEKWHHQKQIREAVGEKGIMERDFFFPVMDTFMRALPHTYRNVKAPTGTSVNVIVNGEAGGSWTIIKNETVWAFGTETKTSTQVEIDPDTAWKLFTKGMTKEEAEDKITFSGQIELGKPILNMLSVMA